MIGAFRVEIAVAIRANRIAAEIFRNRQLMSANSAQNRACFVFVRIPNLRRMSSAFGADLEFGNQSQQHLNLMAITSISLL